MGDVILVTGANGRIGSRVAALLASRDVRVRALVRDVDRANALLPASVEVVAGDLADVSTLAPAVAGVGAALLVSPVRPDMRALQVNLARTLADAGTAHVVKISGLGTALDSFVDSGRWHAEIESDIAALGLPITFLRPWFFMQNLGYLIDQARDTGEVRAGVGDSRIAMIDADDIAEVCVECLVDNALMGQRVALTGPEAVSYADVAEQLGKVLGRQVVYRPQKLDAVRQSLQNSGQPDWHIQILLQFNRAFLEGQGSEVTNVVQRVLGRKPTNVADYLSRAVTASANSAAGRNPFPT